MTKEKFKELVNSGEKFRLYFYAEWCNKCKQMTEQIEKSKVKTFKINGEKYEEITDSFDIKYYPSIVEVEGLSYTLNEGTKQIKKLLNG